MDINGLREIPSLRTGNHSTWTDVSNLGSMWRRINSIGAGTIYEWVCDSPGNATLATFNTRTDLPAGAMMRATDRNFSLWIFNGTDWIPQTNTGPIQVTADRAAAITDNMAILYNSSGTARTITINTGLPSSFQMRIAQASTGKLSVAAGSGVTIISLAGALGTSGAGAVATLTKTTGETYTLSGNIS